MQHGESYNPWVAYGQTKTANLLFSQALAARLGSKGLLSFALHPGVIATNLPTGLKDEDFASLSNPPAVQSMQCTLIRSLTE